MKNRLLVLLFSLNCFVATAQKKILEDIDAQITTHEAEAHLSFLAADEMRGRQTGSRELDIAANYIRTFFKTQQIVAAPGTTAYFQTVDLQKVGVPQRAEATVGGASYILKDNMLVLGAKGIQWSGDMIYVGYGSAEDLARYDVKGKVVLALAGSKEADNINKVVSASREKHDAIGERGALALIEVVVFAQTPWPILVNAFSQESWRLVRDKPSLPMAWLKVSDAAALTFKPGDVVPGSLNIVLPPAQRIPGRNVAALIPGTDTKLKDEYVVITAHYDHVGVQKGAPLDSDSIFNGTRDNAIGTVALLQASRFLAKHAPKRSVILLAVTGEEKGLLGSQWYADHPLVPLRQHVLNINCDGVGYNDKTRITSISLGRTNMDDRILQAAQAFGLTVGGDPDPKENFFERSDQVSFAKKGIPAVKIQPGLAQMDDEIRKYYHRQADEVASLDMAYITRFYKTFVYAVYLLVNDPKTPAWKPGDKFETISKELYSK